MRRPNSMRHLDDAIRRLCGGAPQDFVRARTVMANAIVASMLPDGVVKGGSALKMRFGEESTRFTTDLDTATATDPAAYAAQLDSRLRSGWEGFSGRVVERDPASPDEIPEQYVMQPYDVKLDYLGKPWCTVPLEVGHNEIGDADAADWAELTDAGSIASWALDAAQWAVSAGGLDTQNGAFHPQDTLTRAEGEALLSLLP